MPIERLYHAAPLHLVPSILACGGLVPVETLKTVGMDGRKSVRRRDRKLGLQAYVHLAPKSCTPILADKLRKGYPHALFTFVAPAVLSLPGAAVIPYNPKSWRHREDFRPITSQEDRERIFAEHTAGRYPSLEVLVPGIVPLEMAQNLSFANDAERLAVTAMLAAMGIPLHPVTVTQPELFPIENAYMATTMPSILEYFDACGASGSLLLPPDIPFD